MLQVDLKKTDRELAQIIATRCAGLGVVKSVKVHRDPSPFALIEMASRYESLELAGQYGGSTFGTSALVHLEQEG
jgi:hypothetical protein